MFIGNILVTSIGEKGFMKEKFKTTNPMINRFAQQNAYYLYLVACCVQITIQQDTSNLPHLCEQFKKYGVKIPVISKMRSKRESCEYFYKNRHRIYARMMVIINSKKSDIPHRIMALFLECPNFGIAKASFLGQLAVGHQGLACFDSVNIKQYNIPASVTSAISKNMSAKGKAKRIQLYIKWVYKLGGSEKVWNKWCDKIYLNRVDKPVNRQFKSGLDVSLQHGHWFTIWQGRYDQPNFG